MLTRSPLSAMNSTPIHRKFGWTGNGWNSWRNEPVRAERVEFPCHGTINLDLRTYVEKALITVYEDTESAKW